MFLKTSSFSIAHPTPYLLPAGEALVPQAWQSTGLADVIHDTKEETNP